MHTCSSSPNAHGQQDPAHVGSPATGPHLSMHSRTLSMRLALDSRPFFLVLVSDTETGGVLVS